MKTLHVTIGQFSESPVLTAARSLGIDSRHSVVVTTVRVPSSPGQFSAMRDGTIDAAITSPDNVILYATTDRNPVGERIPVRMLRAIDRGLGLALVSAPEVDTVARLAAAELAVDVVNSGYAMLLFTMLDRLGVNREEMTFHEVGSTPKRLQAVLEGSVAGTILNAESRVRALDAGLRVWSTSLDVGPEYLGTVLAVPAGIDADAARRLTLVWDEATSWLLESSIADVSECLAACDPILGTPAYVDLIKDPSFGLLGRADVHIQDLRFLADIRRACGAYTPDDSALSDLVGQ